MIAHLRGRLLEKHPNRVIVDVNGVGYDVHVPLSTFYEMAEPGEEIALRARVEVLAGYSAHGDRTELQQWLDEVRAGGAGERVPQVYLVHGEVVAQDMFTEQLRRAGYATVRAPERHESVTL